MYRVAGKIKNKPYRSHKKFRTTEAALKFAYSKVFKKDGNNRRKNQLYDFYIERV